MERMHPSLLAYGRLPVRGEMVEYAGAPAVLVTSVYADGWCRLADLSELSVFSQLADIPTEVTYPVSISAANMRWQGQEQRGSR